MIAKISFVIALCTFLYTGIQFMRLHILLKVKNNINYNYLKTYDIKEVNKIAKEVSDYKTSAITKNSIGTYRNINLFLAKLEVTKFPNIEVIKKMLNVISLDKNFFEKKENFLLFLSVVEKGLEISLNQKDLEKLKRTQEYGIYFTLYVSALIALMNAFIGFTTSFYSPSFLFYLGTFVLIFVSAFINKMHVKIYNLVNNSLFKKNHYFKSTIYDIFSLLDRLLSDNKEEIPENLQHIVKVLKDDFNEYPKELQTKIENKLVELLDVIYYYVISESNEIKDIVNYLDKLTQDLTTYLTTTDDNFVYETSALYDIRKNDYKQKLNDKIK